MRRPLITAGLLASASIAISALVYNALSSPYVQPIDAESFRDCAQCPEMVIIQPGSFVMGSEPWPASPALTRDAAPRHTVKIVDRFAVGRFEVTFAEWDACVSDGGCPNPPPDDEGFGRGDRPVLNVSWDDAQLYVAWLSTRTGGIYRLLTEAEWEYAARASTTTPYFWGERASHMHANYGKSKCCIGRVWRRDRWHGTAPVGQFPPNRWGLYDTQGNVYEWVQDCYANSYEGASPDGSTRLISECPHHVIRGGAWYSDPGRIRSAYRAYQTPDKRDRVIGLRVAKTL